MKNNILLILKSTNKLIKLFGLVFMFTVIILSILFIIYEFTRTKPQKTINNNIPFYPTSAPIDSPDTSFVLIDENYSKDNRHVYWKRILIEGAELDSFEIINETYSKDKNSVYDKYTIIENVHPNSFVLPEIKTEEMLDHFVQKVLDEHGEEKVEVFGKNYFTFAGFLYLKNKKIEGIDPKTFRELNSYVRDGKNVFFWREKKGKEWDWNKENLIKNVDLGSFEFLSQFDGNNYAKDKNHIYNALFTSVFVVNSNPDIDIESFSFLGTKYQTDKNNVYLNWEAITEADPSSFVLLNHDKEIAKDSNYVFRGQSKIEVRHVDSFEILDIWYLKDKLAVYWNFETIAEADPSSFRSLGNLYATDKNYVFWNGIPQKDVDVDSFELITPEYYKDKNNVYWQGIHILKTADPTTFNSNSHGQVSDKYNQYSDGEIVNFKDFPYEYYTE